MNGSNDSLLPSNKKTIASSILHHIAAQFFPVVSIGVRFGLPKIELKFTLGQRGPRESGVRSLNLSDLTRGLHGSVINCLENLAVDVHHFSIFECDTHLLERISKSLDSNADWPMSEVGVFSLWQRVVVHVDDFIKVFGNSLGHFVE